MRGDLIAALVPLLLGMALVVCRIPDPKNRLVRGIGAAIVGVLTLRYLYWRVTETVLPFDLSASSIASWLLMAIELLNCTGSLLLLHVLSRVRKVSRSREADAHPVESHPGGPPMIDVLIPTYNESAQILRRTILGARGQDYPAFRVWVCDDLRRPWLREMAAELGVGYLTRPDNRHAKAGNMNAAIGHLLVQPQPPDAFAVLDADFVATPQFLRRAAALLHDPRTAVVQTPQVFFNPDPVQHNLVGSRFIPDEQRFFFDVILPAKDVHGTAFSCGTSAVIRAQALREIGLFPTESVTEDLLLSVKLACAGYTTAYLDERLTAGLAPEGLAEYLTQRGRWCLGTMQIMRTRWSPWSLHKVPFIMRLHTIDAFLFWCMGSLMRLVGFVCPLLYWWFGIGVMRTNADDLLIQMGPYWLCSVVYLGWVSRGAIIPVFTEALTLLVVREALRATLVGLFGKRDQTFKVTAKGARRDQMVVQWDLLRVFLLMLLLTAGGIAWRTWQGPVDAASSASEAISLFWSIYNMFTVTVAALICVELPRRRLEERFATDETTFVTWDHGMALMRIRNISVTGCGLEPVAGPAPPAGSEIALTVPQVGAVSARIVSSSGTLTACAFALTPALHDALLMKLFSGRYLFSPSSMNPIQFFRTALSRVFAS